MGRFIDNAWSILLLIIGLGGAGLFVDLVRRTGDSAVVATQQGLISLPELNKSLFSPQKLQGKHR